MVNEGKIFSIEQADCLAKCLNTTTVMLMFVLFRYKKLYNSAIQQLNADDSISDDSDAESEEIE